MSYRNDNISRIIVAIDCDNEESALGIIRKLDPKLCSVKVGLELYVSCGPKIIKKIHDLGFKIFLDLKFHDIKNTVIKTLLVAAKLGVWMVNLHSSCGLDTMKEAIHELKKSNSDMLILGVTILTSLDDDQIKEIGFSKNVKDQVVQMADSCKEANLDGVVCSALEANKIKKEVSENLICVCPGIRPYDSKKNDQKRTMTPKMAAKSGVDYIVVGRPITNSQDPIASLKNIKNEFEKAL